MYWVIFTSSSVLPEIYELTVLSVSSNLLYDVVLDRGRNLPYPCARDYDDSSTTK